MTKKLVATWGPVSMPLPANPDAAAAMKLIIRYGGIDGGHHKQWVLDQVARALMGARYEAWRVAMCAGEDGPDTYEWDEGTPP